MHPAYILHTRSYRETSLLCEIFCYNRGRVTALAKGVRLQGRRQRSSGTKLSGNDLQPFVELNLDLATGKRNISGLLFINNGESAKFLNLRGKRLICGLYINELILKLLPLGEPHAELFMGYAQALLDLSEDIEMLVALRKFEYGLLKNLGYQLNFSHTYFEQEPLQPEQYYQYDIRVGGALESNSGRVNTGLPLYAGEILLNIGDCKFNDPDTLKAAQQIFRQALHFYGGIERLKTRDLWVTSK